MERHIVSLIAQYGSEITEAASVILAAQDGTLAPKGNLFGEIESAERQSEVALITIQRLAGAIAKYAA